MSVNDADCSLQSNSECRNVKNMYFRKSDFIATQQIFNSYDFFFDPLRRSDFRDSNSVVEICHDDHKSR